MTTIPVEKLQFQLAAMTLALIGLILGIGPEVSRALHMIRRGS